MRRALILTFAAAALRVYGQPVCPAFNFQQLAMLPVQDPPHKIISGLVRQLDRSFTQYQFTGDIPTKTVTKVATVPNFQLNAFACIGVPPRAPKPGPPPNHSVDQLGTAAMGTIVTDLAGDGVGAIVGLQEKFAPNRVAVATANADLTLRNSALYLVGLSPVGVLAGDFNGDGKHDVAVVYNGPPVSTGIGGVSILLGNGDGTLRPAVNYPTGSFPAGGTAFDFNGDGRTDLAVANAGDGNVVILLANPDGTLRPGGTYNVGPVAITIAATDVNGDGKVDLNVLTETGVTVLLGNGDGTFRTGPITPFAGGGFFSFIATGDFNKDGKVDVALLNPNVGLVVILLGAGDGTFSFAHAYLATPGQDNFFVEDFDGDGNPDLVFASGHPDVLTPDETRTMGVLLGNGDGTFIGVPAYPVGSDPINVVTADFNGDGKPDLATAGFGGVGISVLLGQGGSVFKPAAPISINGGVTSIAAGDLNGDGKPDIVITDGQNNVDVFIGNGDGTFRPPVPIPVNGTGTSFVVIGDFNNDNKPDLAVADGPTNTVRILLGNGDGTFKAPISVTVGNNPTNLVTGDFNGDGKLDLAVANSGKFFDPSVLGGISILIGKGDGTFQPAVSYAAVINPNSISTGDFNGDGKTDLIVTATLPDLFNFTLVEFRGNGDGTFQPGVLIPTEFGPNKVAVADFNGDGKQDLIVPHCCGETDITYLVGNGDGTFQPEQVLVRLATSSSVVADFNADGKPDVAFSDSGNNFDTISVFLNLSAASISGTPALVAAVGGSGQSTLVNTPFPIQLQALVTDSGAHPLGGVTVTFTAPASGPSATFAGPNTVVTNAAGIAAITATANGTAGSYNVTAAVGALSAVFALTNTNPSGGPTVLTASPANATFSTSSQTVTLNASLTSGLGTVNGGTVTFTIPGAGSPVTAAVSGGTASAVFTIPANTPAGTYPIQAAYSGAGQFTAASDNTKALTIAKATPTVTWANPADIVVGTALGPIQLNATANVPGTFTYTPPAGTVLGVGNAQTLSVLFTPTDTVDYNTKTATVLINVTPATGATVLIASPANATFSSSNQTVLLSATLTSSLGTVNGGTVTFTIPGAGSPVTAPVSGGAASAMFTIPANTPAGIYPIQAAYSGAGQFPPASDNTKALTIGKATPAVVWANPPDITAGTALGPAQLNATANVPGTFTYTPPAGTVLGVGNGQKLSVLFTPADTADYNTQTASVLINVKPAIQGTGLSITNYQFVSLQSGTGRLVSLMYRADLVNPGAALGSVTATLTNVDPFSVRIVPGQDTLNFSPVPANSQVTSNNTFTVLVDPSVPFDPNKLQWTFQSNAAPPVANAGPNQTVKVGSTVTLDGSGSMNPSGVGTLTYNWVFTSRPPGTTARQFLATTVMPAFVADAPGTYVITLTVSNGVATSSATVTVTAVP